MSQGTVFTGALAEDYKGCRVYGLVVTARCDLVHDKFDKLSYLPVVCLEDWLCSDGGALILERAAKDRSNRIKNILKSSQLNPNILVTEALTDIASMIESRSDLKGAKGHAKRLKEEYQIARDLQDEAVPIKDRIKILCKTESIQLDNVILSLIENKISGFYFIEKASILDTDSPESGYVVLLREVRHMSREVARRVSDGIDPLHAKTDDLARELLVPMIDLGLVSRTRGMVILPAPC